PTNEKGSQPKFLSKKKKANTTKKGNNINGGNAGNSSGFQTNKIPKVFFDKIERNGNLLCHQSVNCSVFSAIGIFDAKSNSLLSSSNIHRLPLSFTSEPSNDSTTDEDSD